MSAIFANKGIRTVRDLLSFFPRTYEDRTRISRIEELENEESSTIFVQVISSRKVSLRRRGKSIFEVKCQDNSGTITLKWFNLPYGIEKSFTAGKKIFATGVPKVYLNKVDMIHPEISWERKESTNIGRVVPIYTEIEGLSTRVLRNILWNAIQSFIKYQSEDVPKHYLQKHQLPDIKQAIQEIHFPTSGSSLQKLQDFDTSAHKRLIYEEFFKFEYFVLKKRLNIRREQAIPIHLEEAQPALDSLKSKLPFQLTGDQNRVIQDILKDLSQTQPMNRLVQGDVGSGKTAVSLLTAGGVVASGGQVAMMAPTEILAEQHFRNALDLFNGAIRCALLTGKTKKRDREKLFVRLSSGEPFITIGTHALVEESVKFKSLRYVLIDEQHRFGVEQRRILRKKGENPHTLVLTATPIPRTLALTAYGDLSISTIRELPPGRTPIVTKLVKRNERKTAYSFIRKELNQGRQAYFVFSLIADSEAEGFTELESVISEAKRLQSEVFPEFKVGLLHGQMKPDEKATVMKQFKKGEIHILASTTVVEVGVDVPNATVIAIFNAERFGFSQIHQLRGRVGRGQLQSYCFLLTGDRVGATSSNRLEILEKTCDGFKIAEADLELRGPGEFLGTRQSGGLPFRLASLVRDQDWLIRARNDIIDLLQKDPNLNRIENQCLKRFFLNEGSLQFDRLKTS